MRPLLSILAFLALSLAAQAQDAAAPPPPEALPDSAIPVPNRADSASMTSSMNPALELRASLGEVRTALADLKEATLLAQRERVALQAAANAAALPPSATVVPAAPAPAAPPAPAANAPAASSQLPTQAALPQKALPPAQPAMASTQTTDVRTHTSRARVLKPGPIRRLTAAAGDVAIAAGTALTHARDVRIVQTLPATTSTTSANTVVTSETTTTTTTAAPVTPPPAQAAMAPTASAQSAATTTTTTTTSEASPRGLGLFRR